MTNLAEQQTRMQGFTAVFTVLRLLTPLEMTYEAARNRAEPYIKIMEELPQMRSGAVQLVRQAVSERRKQAATPMRWSTIDPRECTLDGVGTVGDAMRLGDFGLRIHRREYTHTCPSHDPNHSALIPVSDVRKEWDMLAVPISVVLQPRAPSS